MTPPAELEVEQRRDVTLARIAGEVDISNAATLRESLSSAVPNAALGLVVDLSRTTYLDSAGVELLFRLTTRLARRQQQLRLALPPSSPICRVLELTGVPAEAPLDPSPEAALAAIRTATAA